MDKPINHYSTVHTNLWANHPHAKIWLAVTGLVVVITIAACIYYLNDPAGKNNVAVQDSALPSTTESTSEMPESSSTANTSTKTSTSAKSNTSSTTNTSAKTIAQELKNINLDDLLSSVDDTEQVIGQFSN